MTFAELARARYSVRKFDPRPVEQETLLQVLEAGRLAPTGCNYQPQRILVVCWDSRESWKHRSGRDIGIVDSTIVLTQMMYRAQELGLGSLIVGLYKEQKLRENFRIPDHYEIAGLLLLGYPAPDCQPHPQLHFERKKLEETVFYGSF